MKYKLYTEASAAGLLTQRLVGEDRKEISKWVCNVREASVASALVELGWTPPPEPTFECPEIEILKEEPYREEPYVNTTENMVRVTLTCSRPGWRKIKGHLKV